MLSFCTVLSSDIHVAHVTYRAHAVASELDFLLHLLWQFSFQYFIAGDTENSNSIR